MKLRKEFLDKVREYKDVDTRKYRYMFDSADGSIIRKPITELDTTSGWQLVAWWSMKKKGWVKE